MPAAMPTLEHQALVDMFREHPELAPRFLANLLKLAVPPHASATVAEASLDQLIPTEFRADLVIDLRDASGALVLAIVLEVQRDEDPDKTYAWVLYVAAVRARRRCPAILLVVAPDPAVAKWAAKPIDLGIGLGSLQPVVLGPTTVPEVTDPAEAEREAELAVLSALAHGAGPHGLDVIHAAIAGLRRVDREHAMVYFHILYEALREPMQRAMKAVAMEQQTEEETGFDEFMREVWEHYRVRDLRDLLLRLTTRAGIALSDVDRARIRACADAETLDHWIENVIGAKTAADVLS